MIRESLPASSDYDSQLKKKSPTPSKTCTTSLSPDSISSSESSPWLSHQLSCSQDGSCPLTGRVEISSDSEQSCISFFLVTISNITYFIYAILLIFIALATIFGRENYGYKAMLPKLALGIILVPFTWWFVQWTISLTSVITASVISIPHDAPL